jgi:iron complex outermembrane receptor protein
MIEQRAIARAAEGLPALLSLDTGLVGNRAATLSAATRRGSFALTLALGVAFAPFAAQAAEAPAAPAPADTAASDAVPAGGDIIVTGTRRSGVVATQSATPVTIASAERLAQTGATTLTQALAIVAPSVNFAQNRSNIGATSAKQIWLRGLSPDETLVLVNGRRWFASANVNTGGGFGRGSQSADLASIPLSAIDHVEVLTDGASALYGSDAVAGVVNVVLRNAPTGGEISSQLGVFTSGHGFTPVISGWKGFALPNDGGLTVSGSWSHHNFVPVSKGLDTRCYYCATATYPVARPDLEATANRNWYTGMGKGYDLALSATLEQPLTDTLKLHGLVNFSKQATDYVTSPRLPNTSANVAALTPDGYQQLAVGKPSTLAAILGLTYSPADVGTFDLAVTYGRNKLHMENNNSENPSYGVNAPRNFYLGTVQSTMVNTELNYTKTIPTSFTASPLTLSAGVAQRWDSYDQKAGDVAAYSFGGVTGVPIGVTGGGYITPDASAYDQTRRSTSAYLGLEGDILPRLTTGIAGRYEHFSDFGSAVTGKFSARYEVSPLLALRASVNSAFKAPSIGQLSLYQNSPIQINPTTANPSGRVETLLVPSGSAIAKAAGGTDLKPEKSINVSGGFVLTGGKHAFLSFDAYYLKIRDRIALSNLISGTAVNAILTKAGYPTVYGVQYFLNMGETVTTGFEVSGHYDTQLGGGTANLNLGVAHNRTKLHNISTDTFSGTPLVDYYRVTSLFYEATPKWKITANESYVTDHWTLTATQTYYGRYGGANTGAIGQTVYFSPSVILDFSAAYKLTDDLEVSAGVQNATNYKPPFTPNTANGGRMTTSNLALVNSGGAFTYIKITKQL